MDAPESKKYDPRLDSLRGISALAIIPFHWGVLPFGWIGVQVFFVLSGMLITESLLKSKSRINNQAEYLGYFFEKRMLRLFPLYYGLLLVLSLVYLCTGPSPDFWREAPFLFTYTSNLQKVFFPAQPPLQAVGHLWTLGVEWQFYLLWPFFVWKLREQSLLRFALVLVFLAPILREITLLVAGSTGLNASLAGRICFSAPWSHWDALALGALLVHGPVRSFLSQAYCWISAALIGLAAGSMVLYVGRGFVEAGTLGFPNHLPYFHESVWGYSLIDLLAACLIALTAEKSWLTSFCELEIPAAPGENLLRNLRLPRAADRAVRLSPWKRPLAEGSGADHARRGDPGRHYHRSFLVSLFRKLVPPQEGDPPP